MGAQRDIRDITYQQLKLLAELGTEAESARLDALPGLGAPYIRLDQNDRKKLDRLASALGDPLDLAGQRVGPGEPLLAGKSGQRRLTRLGLEVARRARLAVDDIDWTKSAYSAAGATPTELAFTCLPAHLIRFRSVLAPGETALLRPRPVEIEASHRRDGGARMAALLNSGRVAFAIGPPGLDVDRPLDGTLLYRSTLLAVEHPRDSSEIRDNGRPTVTVQELSVHELAVTPRGHRSRALLEEAFRHAGLPLQPFIELSDVAALRALSDGGRRVAILPDDSFEEQAPQHWAIVVDQDGKPLVDEHWVYWNSTIALSGIVREQRDETIRLLKAAASAAFGGIGQTPEEPGSFLNTVES